MIEGRGWTAFGYGRVLRWRRTHLEGASVDTNQLVKRVPAESPAFERHSPRPHRTHDNGQRASRRGCQRRWPRHRATSWRM